MNFREFIQCLEQQKAIRKISPPVAPYLAAAAFLQQHDGSPVALRTPQGARIVGNVFGHRRLLAQALAMAPNEIVPRLLEALEHPRTPPCESGTAPCQEVVADPQLANLPIVQYYHTDGGPYITAGIVVVQDPQWGLNLSYHRALPISAHRLALRVLPRHLDSFRQRAKGALPAAMVIGVPPCLALAAASSPPLGTSEYHVAHALAPLRLTKAQRVPLPVPAEAEYVLEGHILPEEAPEGPFVDITGTKDIIRPGPIFEVKHITHRRDPLYHAILPAGQEHKILMGLPKEADILRAVRRVCEVQAVHVTPGGASWLHAVVQIVKRTEDDARRAMQAAFEGHRSLKHVFIVDQDVDPFVPEQVEWALATRFQADRDLMLLPGAKGSSLDPSADPLSRKTCKVGFDLTCPLQGRSAFLKAPPAGPVKE